MLLPSPTTFTDVANPLIGDVSEYERFVVVVVEKSMTTPPVPNDHGGDDRRGLQLVQKNLPN